MYRNFVLGFGGTHDYFRWEKARFLFPPRVLRGFVHAGKIPVHLGWMQEQTSIKEWAACIARGLAACSPMRLSSAMRCESPCHEAHRESLPACAVWGQNRKNALSPASRRARRSRRDPESARAEHPGTERQEFAASTATPEFSYHEFKWGILGNPEVSMVLA